LEKKMKKYHDLCKKILNEGELSNDRTNTGTYRIFGANLRFNLREGFPAVTTKKLAWKAVVSELLWFIEGSGDERRLREILHGDRNSTKPTIWTPNAEADYWKPKAMFEGDLGKIYGVQWRSWGPRIGERVDQLILLIEGLKKDPTGRRHILTAWNPGELDQMALPPCHVMCQFFVSNDKKLSCHMYQRSVDVFLGLPFNIASYALFTHMMAQVCDYEVGELIISTGDTHIYSDHIEQVKEQMRRPMYPEPVLKLNPTIKDIEKFTMTDVELLGYQSHDAIKAKMAV
jgi:thymidylate synthase